MLRDGIGHLPSYAEATEICPSSLMYGLSQFLLLSKSSVSTVNLSFCEGFLKSSCGSIAYCVV